MGFKSLPKAWLARGPGMDVASFTIPRPAYLRLPAVVALSRPRMMACPLIWLFAARVGDAAAAHAPRLGSDGGPSPGSTGGGVNAKFGASRGVTFESAFLGGTGRGRVCWATPITL
jgi:hypothetical protein